MKEYTAPVVSVTLAEFAQEMVVTERRALLSYFIDLWHSRTKTQNKEWVATLCQCPQKDYIHQHKALELPDYLFKTTHRWWTEE